MKVPTDATKVFAPVVNVGNTTAKNIASGFSTDMVLSIDMTYGGQRNLWDRLRGYTSLLVTNLTGAEQTSPTYTLAGFDIMNGIKVGADVQGLINSGGSDFSINMFKRAPSFFDEVCYTGNGGTNNVTHNLGVVPEFVIIKRRSTAIYGWFTFNAVGSNYVNMDLNYNAGSSGSYAISTYANSTQVNVGTGGIASGINSAYNTNGVTYVMYLFATCAGVSKCGSYTGNGTTQTIDCGFTGGARFVLIKRTDDVGNWYVYDTARGMTTLTDPYLTLNTTAAQTATLGSVTTVSTGFALNAAILAAINTSSATYIFLAIA
jgi:hypothetical protein